jgi:hypothetical protein
MAQPPGDSTASYSTAAQTTGAVPPTTGDERVEEALASLADLEELPVNEHPGVFAHIHQRLSEALGDLSAPGHDGGPGQPGDSPRGPHAPGR